MSLRGIEYHEPPSDRSELCDLPESRLVDGVLHDPQPGHLPDGVLFQLGDAHVFEVGAQLSIPVKSSRGTIWREVTIRGVTRGGKVLVQSNTKYNRETGECEEGRNIGYGISPDYFSETGQLIADSREKIESVSRSAEMTSLKELRNNLTKENDIHFNFQIIESVGGFNGLPINQRKPYKIQITPEHSPGFCLTLKYKSGVKRDLHYQPGDIIQTKQGELLEIIGAGKDGLIVQKLGVQQPDAHLPSFLQEDDLQVLVLRSAAIVSMIYNSDLHNTTLRRDGASGASLHGGPIPLWYNYELSKKLRRKPKPQGPVTFFNKIKSFSQSLIIPPQT